MPAALAAAKGRRSTHEPAARPRAAPAGMAPSLTLRRCACGGSCPRCRASAADPKLAVNTPGDVFEREADAAAEAVMAAAPAAVATSLAREPAYTLQRGAPALRRQPADDPSAGVGTGAPALPQTTAWDAFAPVFNTEFAGVLNVFAAPAATAAPLAPAGLQALFTDTQRRKLQDFISTRRIPDRLFNGTDKGSTTAQQRLLLSAHILANGIYQPGSFDQRVHARFCYHWVQIVHHYAGATPPRSDFARGVKGSFDPLGAAVLTTGKSVSLWHEPYVKKSNLPAAEMPRGTGPLHERTRHEEAARKAEEADPAKGARFHRQPPLPIAGDAGHRPRHHGGRDGSGLQRQGGNRARGGEPGVREAEGEEAEWNGGPGEAQAVAPGQERPPHGRDGPAPAR